MPYVAPVVAVVDGGGNLYCKACADANGTTGVLWDADNSALEDATPCRGCGIQVPYDPRAKEYVPW